MATAGVTFYVVVDDPLGGADKHLWVGVGTALFDPTAIGVSFEARAPVAGGDLYDMKIIRHIPPVDPAFPTKHACYIKGDACDETLVGDSQIALSKLSESLPVLYGYLETLL